MHLRIARFLKCTRGVFVDSEGKYWNGSAWVDAWVNLSYATYKNSYNSFSKGGRAAATVPVDIYRKNESWGDSPALWIEIIKGIPTSISLTYSDFTVQGTASLYLRAYNSSYGILTNTDSTERILSTTGIRTFNLPSGTKYIICIYNGEYYGGFTINSITLN